MSDQGYLLPEEGEDTYCFTFVEERKNGKTRFVGKPNKAMKRIHRAFTRELQGIIKGTSRVSFESAIGSLPGCSTMKNALRHVGNRHFYTLDIRNAFPSVDMDRLAIALFGLEPGLGGVLEIRRFLKHVCESPRGGLIQGSPSSPTLFNIYCAVWLDKKLRRFAARPGDRVTRYMDDIVFSSPHPIPFRLRENIRTAVEEAGFTVNHLKSSLRNGAREPVLITGIWRFPTGQIAPKNEFLEKVRDALDTDISSMSKKERKAYVLRFKGMAEYLLSFSPDTSTKRVVLLREEVLSRMRVLRHRRRASAGRLKKILPPRLLVENKTFPPGLLDTLRHMTPLEKVVGKYVKLQARSGGREHFGLCPFHNEKTPSFSVAVQKGFYHCFGCGEHGDVFGFLMRTENLSFPEAVRKVAGWCGVLVP